MKQSPLDHIKIASPCSADWDEMLGDKRKRFCTECKLNVYNLSEMTQRDAEKFLFEAEGRVCVRLYKRCDGTVITQDCPIGWAAIKQKASRIVTAAFSVLIGFIGGVFAVSQMPFENSKLLEEVSVGNPNSNASASGEKLNFKELEPSAKGSNKAGNIELMGGIGSSPLESIMWVFSERYPKQ